MRQFLALFLIGASLFVAACEQVKTHVTRFHDISFGPTSSTFIVLPFDAQAGSLEWREYSRGLTQQFRTLGFVEVPRIDEADFIVMFQYAIDGGSTTTRMVPMYGQTGGGRSTTTMVGPQGFGTYTRQTTTPPTFGITGYSRSTETSFTSFLAVDIIDRRQSTPSQIVKRFEARALSTGESAALSEQMPYLIEAMFKDFPGRSGETITVTLPVKR